MSEEDPNIALVLERAIGEAIEDAVREHEAGFVVKWTALVESVDPDGQRGLWTMTSEDATSWDTVGLLQHGLHIEQAAIVAGRVRGDD